MDCITELVNLEVCKNEFWLVQYLYPLLGWRSGQTYQTVNLAPSRLRRFESCPQHTIF